MRLPRPPPPRQAPAGARAPSGRELPRPAATAPTLGLRANLGQFLLLVLINAFVGAMVGLERDVVPLWGARQSGLAWATAGLSFIISFGVVKALANLSAGHLSDRLGRKGVLVAGWLVGLPVPVLLIVAPSWGWVVAANMLLGVNQGLCWSTTVIMKIDLVGPARRGLAMGLNEAAGYGAVAFAAAGSGYLASVYGLRPWPFVPGVAFALAGLLLSALFVRESHGFARHEAQILASAPAAPAATAAEPATASAPRRDIGPESAPEPAPAPSFAEVLLRTSWRDRSLSAVSQAGLVNNLNDGLAWGLFPLFFATGGLRRGQIGLLPRLEPGLLGAAQPAPGAPPRRVGPTPPLL